MSIGPIQAFVIGFPDSDLFEGRIADELARLSDVGQIRVIDAVFVMREGDDVSVLSVSELDDDQRAELRSAVGALIGLGIAGADGAVAGADLGASADPDAPTAAEVLAVGLRRRPARRLPPHSCWPSSTSGRSRFATPSATRRHRPRPPLVHSEELIVFGMDVGDAIDADTDS